MKHKLIVAVLLAGVALLARAQGKTDGQVEKVNEAQGRITLKHGEIKNLDMPAMKMDFAVKDRAMLGRVQPGDKVRFTADKINGTYTVTSIEVMK